MKECIKERVLTTAYKVVEGRETCRSVAKKVGVSKSTVHLDLSKRLYKLDRRLYNQVLRVLEHNKDVRHLRGGESTKKRYQSQGRKTTLQK